MTPVMYHYVQPGPGTLPNYPYLALADFERQLDRFDDTLGLVGREAFVRWVGGAAAPSGFLLTFDDGLRDHVDFVLPVLRRRRLFGLFYVPSAPLTDGVVLDVHKLHLALGRVGGSALLDRLEVRYPSLRGETTDADVRHYATQTSDLPSKRVKQLLNWKLGVDERREVVDDLLAFAFDGRAPGVDDVYADEAGVRLLLDEGMGVGAHGHQHLLLSRLTPERQEQEIHRGCDLIRTLTGTLDWGCYAHGSEGSFDFTSERLVASTGCPFAFAVADGDIEARLAETTRFALPRRDCNTLGMASPRVADADCQDDAAGGRVEPWTVWNGTFPIGGADVSENGQSQTAGRGTQGATTGLLAVVPARAGSRGVPRKNMAIVAGVPLVEYAVAAALAAESIGAVVVTSDDEEILERYARRDGVLVLRRPPDLATDTASSADTVAHALEQWEAAGGWSPHALIMVQATTPLRTSADIDAAYDLFTRSGSEAVISACRVDGIRHPRVMYRLRDDGRSELFMTDPTDRMTRRDYEPLYQNNGAVYIVSTEYFRREQRLRSLAPVIYEMPWERSINIDVPGDLVIARALIESGLVKTELSR